MKDSETIKKEYSEAIKNFETELGKIDSKYGTIAKIEIDFEVVYGISKTLPVGYFRNIQLEEIILQ